MEINIKEGSAFHILKHLQEHLGGELTPTKYEVKKQGLSITSQVFSLIKGSTIMIHSVNSDKDIYYNVIGDKADDRYLNFRFEYTSDIMKNTEDHEEGMDLQAVGMAVYDTSYSFKTHNKGGQLNQWVSLRISISQMNVITSYSIHYTKLYDFKRLCFLRGKKSLKRLILNNSLYFQCLRNRIYKRLKF